MNHWAALLDYHQALLVDQQRTERYRTAIRRVVKPGDVVVDVGSGIGQLTYFAVQAGAKRVYAIELAESIELAKEIARRNGFADRVVFLHEDARHVTLPEPADVVVSDTVHTFGLNGGILGLMLNARKRLLKPGGRLLPRSIDLVLAPVRFPRVYAKDVQFWSRPRYGLDCSSVRRYAANAPLKRLITPRHVLGRPGTLVRLDLGTIESPTVVAEGMLSVTQAGTLHGLGGWFVANLVGPIAIGNEPASRARRWAHTFFPLEQPVVVRPGDRIRIALWTRDGMEWRWDVAVERRVGKGRTWAVVATSAQSTLHGAMLSLDQLKKRASSYRPRLSRSGEAERFLLERFDGGRTTAELTQDVAAAFPDLFARTEEAGSFVRRIIGHCT